MRQARLAQLAEAKAVLEARAPEQAAYAATMAERAEKERTPGRLRTRVITQGVVPSFADPNGTGRRVRSTHTPV